MDQLDIYERLQLIIDRYERIVDTHMDQLEMQTLLLLDKYYSRYGERMSEYAKYGRLQSLQRELDQLASEQYQNVGNELQTGAEDTFKESYLLYAYLLHQTFGTSEDGEVLPLTKAAAKVSVGVAIALLLIKAAKVPRLFFTDEQVDIGDVMTKHKNDYVYNVMQDVKNNLRAEAGYADASNKVKKRARNQRGYGKSYLYELYNNVMNYTTEKIHDVIHEQMNTKKMWLSMRDNAVRMAHRILDGQFADKEGYFHYGGDKAKRPKTFKNMELNYGCRCKLVLLLDGVLPRSSNVYDYRDRTYNDRLQKKIKELREQDEMTYAQALRKADKVVKPPKRTVKGHVSYDEWLKKYGPDE